MYQISRRNHSTSNLNLHCLKCAIEFGCAPSYAARKKIGKFRGDISEIGMRRYQKRNIAHWIMYKRDDVSTFDAISINCLHCQLHSNDYSTSIFTVECGRVCVFHFYFIRFDSILFDFVAVFSFIFLGVIRCCWCLISLTFTFTLALSVCLGLLKRRKSVKYCAF